MRITLNIREAIEMFRKSRSELQRRMISMVTGFNYELVYILGNNTPKATDYTLEAYEDFYIKRFLMYGLPSKEKGYHAGAYEFSLDGNFEVADKIRSPDFNSMKVSDATKSEYRIGQTYYIGAKGFAYEELDAGSSEQAPRGITIPTLEQVMRTYAINSVKYFNRQL